MSRPCSAISELVQSLFDLANAAAAADKFSGEYSVQHRRRNTVDPASRWCITTIQRLSSMLKGEEKYDEANEEGSLFELGPFVVPPSGGYNAEESIRRSKREMALLERRCTTRRHRERCCKAEQMG